MSVVLSIYSESANKEFVLPAIHNAETVVALNRKTFNLIENIELCLEEMDKKWYFLPSSGCNVHGRKKEEGKFCLMNQANYILESEHKEILSVMVQMKRTSFVSYKKYDLSSVNQVRIGDDETAEIHYHYSYEGLKYVSKEHCVLKRQGEEVVLIDVSRNGVFVNDVRVRKSQVLKFGDRIHLWGLDIVFLGKVLAVRDDKDVVVNEQVLKEWTGLHITFNGEESSEKTIYHRAPRIFRPADTEPVEIEAPPAPKEQSDVPLLMAIGPAMTMAIPMVLSSVAAIAASRSTGASTSAFMYTGIITALTSAIIGVGWGFNNVRYNKKKVKQAEQHRCEAYGKYLTKRAGEIKEKYIENTQNLHYMYRSAKECVSKEFEEQNLLWGRNSTHPDFLSHRLGIGNLPFQAQIQIPKEKFTLIDDKMAEQPKLIREKYSTLHKVPVCLDLMKEKMIGLAGGEDMDGVYPVVYNLVAQIASQNCYTDVKMAFVFEEDNARWGFAKWLPHTWSPDKKVRYVASDKNEASDVFYELTKILRFRSEENTFGSGKNKIYKPHYILFLENPSCLEGELLEKYIFDKETNLGITVIFMTERCEELPNACECIIRNDREFHGLYYVRTGERREIEFDILEEVALETMARRLANVEVSETEVGGDIPNSITFFDMYGVSRLDEFHVEERWKKNRTYVNMKALVGQRAGGAPCYLDVHEKYHGPHGLVAGTTGSGKSETLQTYMLSLALNFSPDDIGFFIIDYKGGGMANLFDGLPHILGQISNLSGNQVHRAMVSIKSENKRRQRVFNEQGVNNINAYTTLYKNGEATLPIPHLFIIIDEFAELKREESDFMKELISVAQVGRSLGVHLILATQKPAGTVDENIWSNSKFRLCLRVQDRQDSMDMLHKPDAAFLTQAGRAYLQVGNDEVYELFQSGWSGAVYDENEENARQVLAVMLTDTGKAALVGSYVKRKINEQMKQKWIGQICSYLEESISEWGLYESNGVSKGISKEEFVLENTFELFEEDGIEYANNSFNVKSLKNLLELYEESGVSENRTEYILKMAALRGIKLPEIKGQSQLDALVKYLAEVAKREGYRKPQQLWLPVLPSELLLASLEDNQELFFDGKNWSQYGQKWELKTMIGLCDDPANQAQMPLSLNFTENGHLAVCGIAMSGKSTFLQSVIYSLIHRYSPEYLNVYILDFSSKMLGAFEHEAHVGGVLYETDLKSVGKLFYMLETMITERKELFRGGNYSQYVMTHGVTCPVVMVVMDNIANFREKTKFQYDDRLVQITRECASYGIYFMISGAGFKTSEITSRMRDNIHQTYCLEMTDRFAYGDCLNTMQLSVIPEGGIHGRGLAMVNGNALEFQTALSVSAEDDYERQEKIVTECELLNSVWSGKKARQIPMIPEKPVWQEFTELESVGSRIADDHSLPVGYDLETADVYSVDLSRNYCYLISGKGRTGKTNYLKALMYSANMKKGKIVVVEPGGLELQKSAEELHAKYINTYDEYMSFLRDFIPVFQERNRKKKECLKQGMEEYEIYQEISEEQAYFIFIADLAVFTELMHGEQGRKDNLCGAMGNLFEKGFLHNIYFFACMNQDDRVNLMGKEVYDKFVRGNAGIHFGGNVAAQRIFDFVGMPFSEQSVADKPGIGTVPPMDNEPYRKVMIPLVKGKQVI